MNNCTFVGTLGRDWELKGKAYKNSLAVKKYDKSTLWVPLVAFGKSGETLEKYTGKGEGLAVSGELDFNEYEGKTYTSVKVANFTFVNSGKKQAKQETSGDDIPF